MRVQDEGRSNAAHWHKVAAEQRVRAEKAEAENAQLRGEVERQIQLRHATATDALQNLERAEKAEAENARLRSEATADSRAEVIAAWNRRAPSTLREELEALADALYYGEDHRKVEGDLRDLIAKHFGETK